MAAVLRRAEIGDGTARVHGLRSSLTRPARPFIHRQRGSAGVASSDLRGRCRVRCGRKIACGALRRGSASGWSELPGLDPPAGWSGRKAQPHGPAVATETGPRTAPLNRMGLPAKWPLPSSALWDWSRMAETRPRRGSGAAESPARRATPSPFPHLYQRRRSVL